MIACALAAILAAVSAEELSVVLVAPARDIVQSSRSDIYRSIGSALARHVDLSPVFFEQLEEIEECQGAFGCVALRARGPGRFVVFLSIKGDRMSAVLLDTRAVLEQHVQHAQSVEEFENAVFEKAVAATSGPVEMHSGAEVASAIEQAFLRDFRAAFERSGHWYDEGAPMKMAITATATRMEPEDWLLKSGLIAGGAGVATFFLGELASGPRPSACAGIELSMNDDMCTGGGLDKIPGWKISLAAVGYSLALSGATWTLAALLDPSADQHAWLWIAIGAAAGVATFAVSTALDLQ